MYYWSAGYNKRQKLVTLAILGITTLECRLLVPESGQLASRSCGVQVDVLNGDMDKH